MAKVDSSGVDSIGELSASDSSEYSSDSESSDSTNETDNNSSGVELDEDSSDSEITTDDETPKNPTKPVELKVENLGAKSIRSNFTYTDSISIDLTIDDIKEITDVPEAVEYVPETVEPSRVLDPTCYFDDGQRIIDFVLVYKESKSDSDKDVERAYSRRHFEEKLIEAGIDLEHEQGPDDIHFMKLHANWDCLARQAEIMQLLAPIQENTDCEHNKWWGSKLIRMALKRDPWVMSDEYKAEEKVYYRSRFDQRRMEIYVCPDRDKFFTKTQRIRIVHTVLQCTSVGFETLGYNEVPMNFEFFLRNGTYSDAYPLHDGSYLDNYVDTKKYYHYRKWLKDVWASCTLTYQPIPQIRAYFGDKIAIYFALMGQLTKQLLIPSLLAIFCLIYGISSAYAPDNPVVKDICESKDYFCRSCARMECPVLKVNLSCDRMKYVSVFDNVSLIFYSVFICLWGVSFLESWKQVQAEFASGGDFTDAAESHSVRYDYVAKATETTYNADSGTMEPTHPAKDRIGRMATAMLTTLFFIAGLTGFLFGIGLYRMIAVDILRKRSPTLTNVSVVAWITASLITGLKQIVFEVVYRKVALWLVQLECPVTEKQFEQSFIRKFMTFQFVNYYGELLYVGVLKGHFAGSPHNQSYYTDRCSPLGCYIESNLHFVTVVVCKEIVYILKIYVKPKIVMWLKGRPHKRLPRWEKDFNLNEFSNVGISVYYEDLVITYGFIVLFGSYLSVSTGTFLLYFLVKIRLDGNHLLTSFKRPVPESCGNIGVWMDLLALITRMATLSNALIIAFSSHYIDRITYQYLYSMDTTLKGFVDFTTFQFDTVDYVDPLLRFNPTDPSTNTSRYCNVRAFRYNYDTPTKYDREARWWVIMVMKMAFILIFEHLVSILQNAVIHMTQGGFDENTKLQLERRKLLEKRAYVYCEMQEKKRKLEEIKQLRINSELSIRNGSANHKTGRRQSHMSNILTNKLRRLQILETLGEAEHEFNPFKRNERNEPGDNPYLRKRARQMRTKQPYIVAVFKWLNVYCRS